MRLDAPRFLFDFGVAWRLRNAKIESLRGKEEEAAEDEVDVRFLHADSCSIAMCLALKFEG